jgi:hypothetical protein
MTKGVNLEKYHKIQAHLHRSIFSQVWEINSKLPSEFPLWGLAIRNVSSFLNKVDGSNFESPNWASLNSKKV